MIYVKASGVECEYFTRIQADKNCYQYIPWRDATGPGQWILTDDNYVLKTTQVKYITEIRYPESTRRVRVRRKVYTALGIRFPHGKLPFNLAENIEKKSFGYYPLFRYEVFDRNYPAVKTMLVRAILTGKLRLVPFRRYYRWEYDTFIRIAKRVFDNSRLDSKGRTLGGNWYDIRTFYGHEKVRDMIRQEIMKIAVEKGVSVEKVFDLLNEATKLGRAKGDGKVLIAVAKEFAGIIGMATGFEKGKQNGQLPPADEDLPNSELAFDEILRSKKETVDDHTPE